MYKRRCENWLESFLQWTLPISETPESMLRWTGVFVIASVMKRKVLWPKSLLGGYEIFPSLYIILVGNPAVVRKSTTIGFCEELLSSAPTSISDPITFAADVTSHSKLLDALSNSPDSSVVVLSSEFSSLLQTTPESMYEILTDLFDNRKTFNWETWTHGSRRIENPVVNLLAATTPAWISKQPPEYFVGGGFASRIIFIYEEEPRQREIFYDHVDQELQANLRECLCHDLGVISSIQGEFSFDTPGTKEYIREWYRAQKVLIEDPRLQGYFGRKHVHALKLSMILSLAERSDRKVTKAHWDTATGMLDYVERKMSRAFHTLGANPLVLVMDDIVDFIRANGPSSLREISGRFYRTGLTLEQFRSALTFLVSAGKLKVSGSITSPIYSEGV